MVVFNQAFNAGATTLSDSLKPVKESVESLLQLKTDNGEHESTISIDLEVVSLFSDNVYEQFADKYPAPSTPQLKQGVRLLDDGDCHELTNISIEKENGESKSVETSCENLIAESSPQPMIPEETVTKDEEDIANGSKGENVVSVNPHNRKFLSNTDGNASPDKTGSCENKANRKKTKVSLITIYDY